MMPKPVNGNPRKYSSPDPKSMSMIPDLVQFSLNACHATIGTFDGVHRGHQVLIAQLVSSARQAGNPSVVVTFFPHPAVLLRNIEGPYYLTSSAEREDILKQLGVDHVITLPFTRELANLTAQEFMSSLQSQLHIRHLWVGDNFALGRNREGDIPNITLIGKDLGYTVGVIPTSTNTTSGISSSIIRQAISSGNVTQAAALLGRYHRVCGEVVQGDGRGKSIGIPTANLKHWQQQLLPTNGVYATKTWVNDQFYPSVTNIGSRPTFDSATPGIHIETLLIGYNQDLYGLQICLEFVQYLRAEQRFASVDALLKQIQEDINTTQEVLNHAPRTQDLFTGPSKA
jgi:riboflavin kinase / FMN adenylyltransferase